MKFIKYLIIILFTIVAGCVTTEQSAKEEFGIYGIHGVELKCKNGLYRQIYRIHFTPNVAHYSVTYYYPVDDGWGMVDTDYNSVPDKKRNEADESVGVLKGLEVEDKVPVKIEIVAYKYSETEFTPTVTKSHIFNIHKSEVTCLQSTKHALNLNEK